MVDPVDVKRVTLVKVRNNNESRAIERDYGNQNAFECRDKCRGLSETWNIKLKNKSFVQNRRQLEVF